MFKILIIEDDKGLNEAYATILKRQGYQVEIAYNGQEALNLIKKTVPDLILLDLRMPQMDGVEFLKELKSSQNYPDLKIVVFSNYDDNKEIEEAFKYGATRYILKAWSSPTELVKVVNESLAAKPASSK